jgi:4-nitrophenyl phosphatase
VLFVTNNALRTIDELQSQLSAIDIDTRVEELLSSAQAAASLLAAGSTAYVVGGPGLNAAVSDAGVGHSATSPDAVVVGLAPSFDYATCDAAARFVRAGATFIATNVDATLPGTDGLHAGAGAIVAAIQTAAGTAPIVAGKPYEPMARLAAARSKIGAVVGDRPSTDGAFATRLGVPFAHVVSQVVEDPSGGPEAVVRVATLLEAVVALCV